MTGADAVSDDRERMKMLALTSLALVATMSPWFSATAIAPELARLWDLGTGEVAWLTLAVQIGFVTGALALSISSLPDIVPLRRLMAVAAVVAAVANVAPVLVQDYHATLLARFITGASLAGLYPPALKLLATWFATRRGFALGCAIAALTLGSALPHLLRASPALDWRLVLTATSAATLCGGAILLLAVRDGPFPFPTAAFRPSQIGRVFQNRAVALASLGYFGHMWELYAMWAWLFAFSAAALAAQSSTLQPSLLTFAAIASGVVGCIAGGWLSDRYGRTLTTSGMMIASATCALFVGAFFDGPFYGFVAVVALWGATVIGDSAQFSAVVTEVGDRDLVGTALTLQLGIGFGLTICAIWLVPWVVEALGSWRWAFVVLVPGPALGAAAMLILRRLPEAAEIANGRR